MNILVGEVICHSQWRGHLSLAISQPFKAESLRSLPRRVSLEFAGDARRLAPRSTQSPSWVMMRTVGPDISPSLSLTRSKNATTKPTETMAHANRLRVGE